MYLVIAEKPSVSNSIAKVLGAYQKKDGYLEGRDYIVSWCLGHLAEYVSPDSYDERFSKWNYEDLPIIPDQWRLAVSKDKKEQFAIVKELLKRNDIAYVVNACDAGREGELIFKRVYDLSGSQMPVKRLWISSLEDSAIEKGFRELRPASEYENLANAAVCRAQADWLIGMNATRAFTTKYFKRLTVGRVQTPTLCMLVDRGNEIANFRKAKYFNVAIDLNGMKLEKQKIFDEADAEELLHMCQGNEAVILKENSTDRIVKPPKLYDLTTLQREANRHYGLTAQQTLNAAQSLYEQKLITYPRTDSQFLTEDMEDTAANVIRIVQSKYGLDNPFSDIPKPIISQVMNNKKVSDHHAIIPTMELEKTDPHGLKADEEKVLFLVSLRLLEATGENHIFTETIVEASCGGETFSTKGKVIKYIGWKQVEEFAKDFAGSKAEREKDAVLPKVKEGQRFTNVKADKSEHYTTPPKTYSEDTLLAAMETAGNKEFDENTEKKGLGTPATRANIIEKLVNSKYVVRKGKQLIATDDGKALIEVLPDFLKSASMTAEWENQLLDMEKGKIAPEQFMTGIKGMISMMLNGCDQIPEEDTYRFQQRESIGVCPVCGSLVYEGQKNFYCSNRECSFVLWKENRYLERMKKRIDSKLAAELLKSGQATVKDFYSYKKDMYFEADLVMDYKDGRVNFSIVFPDRSSLGRTKHK